LVKYLRVKNFYLKKGISDNILETFNEMICSISDLGIQLNDVRINLE